MAGRAAELADAKDLGFRKWRFFNVPNRSFELRLWPMFTGLKCTFTFPESVCQGREIPTSKVAQKWHRPPYMAALRPPRAGVRSPAICPCRLAPCRVCATRRAWGVFLVATGVRARSGANATPGAKARYEALPPPLGGTLPRPSIGVVAHSGQFVRGLCPRNLRPSIGVAGLVV